MPLAAKAFFTVTAGIIPGESMREHSRQWSYTSADHAADVRASKSETTRFIELRDEAMSYAQDLIDPRHVNWVGFEFTWV